MIRRRWIVVLTVVAVAGFALNGFAASQKVLYSFTARRGDGEAPLAGVIFDSAGNLYGTTEVGGSYGDGIVFELGLSPDGQWAETVLHDFNWTDGAHPQANLVFDNAGNLYGTTVYGGAYGKGTVFELSPADGGGWTEEVLHSFPDGQGDGYHPYAPLIFDSAGNLYGTAAYGGAWRRAGVVFELTPGAGGNWTETILCNFPQTLEGRPNGWSPYSGLVFDAAGDLYGTTTRGGHRGEGSVFELTPSQDGSWTEMLLASLTDEHGEYPYGSLILDAAGNLYGTASEGGAFNAGTVFKVSTASGGGWMLRDVYSFSFPNEAAPVGGLVMDRAGNIYGTTEGGGSDDAGTIFEMTPNKDGGWSEGYFSVIGAIYSKTANSVANPVSDLVFDAHGNAYGTSSGGGAYGAGTVFEIIR